MDRSFAVTASLGGFFAFDFPYGNKDGGELRTVQPIYFFTASLLK